MVLTTAVVPTLRAAFAMLVAEGGTLTAAVLILRYAVIHTCAVVISLLVYDNTPVAATGRARCSILQGSNQEPIVCCINYMYQVLASYMSEQHIKRSMRCVVC